MIYATIGSMGSGKTTLISQLVDKYGYTPIYEEFTNNPYIQEAYLTSRMKYENQKWFINNDIDRLRRAISLVDETCVIDKLFVQNYVYLEKDSFLFEQKKEMCRILDSSLYLLNEVDVIIYFYISTDEILRRINQRNRFFEKKVSYTWIDALNEGCLALIDKLRVLFPSIKIYQYNGYYYTDNTGEKIDERIIYKCNW